MAAPSYACVNFEKIKNLNSGKGCMKYRYEHNTRETHIPKNVDPEMSKYNKTYVAMNEGENYVSLYRKEEEQILASKSMRSIRSDAVKGIEAEIGYSKPESINLSVEEVYKWGEDVTKWLKDKFGENNVKHVILHCDEDVTYDDSDPEFKNPEKHMHPHIHAFIIPIDDRNHLNSHSYLSPTSLRRMQSSFYEEVGKKYNMLRGEENSQISYKDIRKMKAHKFGKAKTKVDYFEPTPEEFTPSGDLKPEYAERVKDTATTLAFQQEKEITDILAETKLNRIEGRKKLKKEEELLKKEIKEKEEALESEYKKKLHLLEVATNGLKYFSRGSKEPSENLQQKIHMYSTVDKALADYPDKDFISEFKSNLKKLYTWERTKEKEAEKNLGLRE